MSNTTKSVPSNRPQVVLFGILVAIGLYAYAGVLAGIWNSWNTSSEMSHGMLVVPLVLGLIYSRRAELVQQEFSPHRAGLTFGFLTLLLHAASIAVQNQFLGAASLYLYLLSLLFAIWGPKLIALLAGPLILPIFAIQPPVLLYESLTIPLQLFASASGELILELLGFTVLRQGNILQLPGFTLSVADACSGLASLYSMTFLATACVVYAGFNYRLAIRMAFAAFLVSMVANTIRIILTAILGTVKQGWTQGDVHESVGYITFLLGSAVLIGYFLASNRGKRSANASA